MPLNFSDPQEVRLFRSQQLQKGRNPQEVDNFIRQQVQTEVSSSGMSALGGLDAITSPEPIDTRNRGFLAEMARSIVNPVIKGVNIIGESLGQTGRTVSDLDRIKLLLGRDISEKSAQRIANEPINVFAPEDLVRDISGNIGKGVSEGFRGGAGIANLVALLSGGGLKSTIGKIAPKAVSTIAPLSTGAKVVGTFGREALLGTLYGGAQEKSTLKSSLGTGLLAGGMGGIIQASAPVVKGVVGKVAPKLSDIATTLEERSFIKRFGRPTKSEGAVSLIKDANTIPEFRGAKNIGNLVDKSTSILKKDGPTINNITIKLSKQGKIIDASSVVSFLEKELKDAPTTGAKRTIQKVLDEVMSDLSPPEASVRSLTDFVETTKSTLDIDPNLFYKIKQDYGKRINWDKFDPSKENEANLYGQVYSKMNVVMDKMLKDNGFSEFRVVNNRLHVASKVNDFATRISNTVPTGNNLGLLDTLFGVGTFAVTKNPLGLLSGILGRKIVESPQATGLASKSLELGGDLLEKATIPQIPSSLARILAGGVTLPKALTQGQFAEQQRTQVPEITQQIPQATQRGGGISKEMQDTIFMLKVLDPKNADVYNNLAGSGVDKKTEAQVARDNTQFLIENAFSQLQTNPKLRTGLIGSPTEQLKAKIGIADQPTLDFNITISNLNATIAKARGGTSFTPNEQKLLDRYAPKVGDSRQELLTKLRKLNEVFNQ